MIPKSLLHIASSHLWREKAGDGDAGREADGDRHGSYPQRHMVAGAEVQGDERQPDHTGGIHREPWKINGLLAKKPKNYRFIIFYRYKTLYIFQNITRFTLNHHVRMSEQTLTEEVICFFVYSCVKD